MEINKHKTGLVAGLFVGFMHFLWTVCVALGWAQPMLNFVYKIHFLNNPFEIAHFGFKRAAALLVVTTVVGYAAGWIFAIVFNQVHKR